MFNFLKIKIFFFFFDNVKILDKFSNLYKLNTIIINYNLLIKYHGINFIPHQINYNNQGPDAYYRSVHSLSTRYKINHFHWAVHFISTQMN
jgi:hypothetical protein